MLHLYSYLVQHYFNLQFLFFVLDPVLFYLHAGLKILSSRYWIDEVALALVAASRWFIQNKKLVEMMIFAFHWFIFGNFTQNFCGWNFLGMEGEKEVTSSWVFFFFGTRSSLWVVRFDSLGPPLTEEVGFYLHRHLRVRMGLSERNMEMTASIWCLSGKRILEMSSPDHGLLPLRPVSIV